MRNLLAFLAFALLVFLGLGWYFGWYKIEKVPTVTGRPGYQIEIDSKKIKQDGTKFLERASDELQEFLDRQRAKDDEPGANKDQSLMGPPHIISTGVTEPEEGP